MVLQSPEQEWRGRIRQSSEEGENGTVRVRRSSSGVSSEEADGGFWKSMETP